MITDILATQGAKASPAMDVDLVLCDQSPTDDIQSPTNRRHSQVELIPTTEHHH